MVDVVIVVQSLIVFDHFHWLVGRSMLFVSLIVYFVLKRAYLMSLSSMYVDDQNRIGLD